MRAITVRQPWAWAILYGGKDVENRVRSAPWTSAIGETLAIHAAKQASPDWDDDLLDVAALAAEEHFTWEERDYLDERGTLLGTAVLVGIHHWDECAGRCSRWAHRDVFHLVLARREPLTRTVGPIRGALGLWTLPETATAAIARQATA
jgi:hypothetical protein